MPLVRSSVMSDGEKEDILKYLHTGKTIKETAYHFGRHENSIRELVKKLRPTTQLARSLILARASELTEKVLEKADVDQLIDILSRPNVGVFDPAPSAKGGGLGGGGNILINIQAGSLAAVNESEYVEGQVAKEVESPAGSARSLMAGGESFGQLYEDKNEDEVSRAPASLIADVPIAR